MSRLTLLIALAACTTRPAEPPPAPEPAPVAALNLDDPSACAACHAEVVNAWRTSLHSDAHHGRDPVYGAMLGFRSEKQGKDLAPQCGTCHTPRAPSEPESEVALTGVSCATCHAIDGVDLSDGKKGANALLAGAPAVVRGPHDPTGAAAPHGVGPAAPWLTDGKTMCLACHAAEQNPQGVATCTTGAEHGELEGAPSCTSCHMPEVAGPSGVASTREKHRSHAFLGPSHLWEGDPSLMAKAATVTGSLAGDTLTVSLTNTSGHGLPSGFPGRMVLVRAVGRDAGGAEVWSNFTDDPMAQDPQAVLTKVYVDADGKPVMPPFASAIAKDTRLRADETRALTWSGVPAAVTTVEVTLLYRLLPPPAAQALGLAGSSWAEARPMARATVAR
jgi:hypothetical protein